MRYEHGRIILEHTPPATCELCGTMAELRPYGPGGAKVCYPCAMKDRETMEAKAAEAARRVVTLALSDPLFRMN